MNHETLFRYYLASIAGGAITGAYLTDKLGNLIFLIALFAVVAVIARAVMPDTLE